MKKHLKYLTEKSPIFTSRGLGILEAVVTITIITMSSIAIVYMSVWQSLATTRSQQTREADNLLNEISLILSDSRSCAETLKFKDPMGAGSSLSQIVRVDTAGVATTRFAVNDIYGNNKIKIDSLMISNYININAINDGTATLTINLARQGGLKGILSRSLLVNVVLDASNNVIRCKTEEDAFIEAACSAMGGTIDGHFCVNINITGNVEVDSSVDAMGTLTVSSIQAVNAESFGPVSITGDLTTSDDITTTGPITLSTVTAASEIKANSISGASQICVGANCRDFNTTSCPGGQYANGVLGNGNLSCLPIPPPPPPPPPPP